MPRSEILELSEVIKKRWELEDWQQRKYFAELSLNIYAMLGGTEKKKITDLIGEPPHMAAGPVEAPQDNKTNEWKAIAKARGLNIGGE